MDKNKGDYKSGGIDWSVLPVGSENAIGSTELCELLGFSDDRALRYAVTDARLNNIPICSLSNGYFMADREKPEQIEHCINTLRKRAFTSLKQAAILTRWKNGGNEFEQMSIGDFLREAEREARGIG